jgi:uncharacterized LabA/DUF88 family protein
MDFWNFARDWRKLTRELPDRNFNWKEFPSLVMEELDSIRPLRSVGKELRAVKVYASTKPPEYMFQDGIDRASIDDEELRRKWLTDDLDQITSYTVDISSQTDRTIRCDKCSHSNIDYTEQGIDTKIAIDLVALASRNLYDIAVLVTDDTDLIPSIQCVQNALDKQVVHLGFEQVTQSGKRTKNLVRNEAWSHLFIDSMLGSLEA